MTLFMYCGLLVFYLLRRRRLCYDLSDEMWENFQLSGKVFLAGYLFHYIPYFFMERTLFLHNYLPAFVFKVLLMVCLIEHIFHILKYNVKSSVLVTIYLFLIFTWIMGVFIVFQKFLVLSYGRTSLSITDIINLRWRDTWDFIIHK